MAEMIENAITELPPADSNDTDPNDVLDNLFSHTDKETGILLKPRKKGKRHLDNLLSEQTHYHETPMPTHALDQDEHDIIMNYLYPNQRAVVKQGLDILKWSNVLFNKSLAGTGKTPQTLATCRILGLQRLIILCDNTAKSHWRDQCEIFGYPLENVEIKTYRWLIDKNPYVEKRVIMREKNQETYYTCKDAWFELVRCNVGLILDECQNVKNSEALCTKAIQAMSSYICRHPNTNSRVFTLSATPFHDRESVLAYLRIIGMYNSTSLCSSYINEGMNYKGFFEIRNKVTQFLAKLGIDDVELTEGSRAIQNQSARKTDLVPIVFKWFHEHILPYISICIPRMETEATLTPKNVYYEMDFEPAVTFWTHLTAMAKIFSFNQNTGEIRHNTEMFSQSTALMRKIEVMKTEYILVREVRHLLETNPRAKVVVFCNFLESMGILERELADFDPLIIKGKVKEAVRGENVGTFRTDRTRRLMLTNLATGATSISLESNTDDEDRHVFIIPTFSLEKMQQAVYRCFRVTSKGNVFVNIVYVNIDFPEHRLHKAIWKKSEVYAKILKEHIENGMVFINDYEIERQGETLMLQEDIDGGAMANKLEREMEALRTKFNRVQIE